jgi:CubicO group peptidase (beta-lactamase class C family)
MENAVDSLINSSIELKAFPGAQLYIKKGDYTYKKSYGFHTYDSVVKVEDNHLFDLASITKSLAGTLAIMKMTEDIGFDLNKNLKFYLEDFNKVSLGNSSIKDLLTHTAGWEPYISHQEYIVKKNGNLKKRFIKEKSNKKYSNKVSRSLFIKNNYYRLIKKRIKKTQLNDIGSYKYSGLFFCLIPEIIKKHTNQSLNEYLNNNFYNPLNLSTSFNPLSKFSLNKIVPTEIDDYFRNELVQGTVHDETSALMGGLSANAGLFSNAEDLSIILELLLQGGTYKNKKYLEKNTIELFTKNQIENDRKNRRGLGFDKKRIISENEIYPHPSLSKSSFGHTGFTGTMFWVDPEKELIFIFLTNRVHPKRNESTFYKLNVRQKLLNIIL